MKILLVDDNEDNLDLFKTLLKKNGHAVICAKNGLEALEKLRENHIDMIVSDILMPEMDGYRLCRECKKDSGFKKLPFIFLTAAYTEKKDKDFALSLGAESFIEKPIAPDEFLRAVEDIIKRQREGTLEKREAPSMKEISYLTEYNDRLINKLEQHVQELEKEISGRKKAEDALIESEQKFKSIFNSATDGILLADENTKGFYMGNKAICRWLGYSHEEIENLGITDIHPVEHLPYVMEQFERQAKGEITLAKDIPVKRKDGSVFYADIRSAPITLNEKFYLMGIFRDITERKQTEEALRESMVKLKTITSAANDAIIMIGNEGEILFWNEAAEKIFGYSIQEVYGENLHIFLAPQRYHDAYTMGFERFKMTGEGAAVGKTLELSAIRKNGEEFPVELSVSAVKFAGKWHSIGIIRDITDRKRIEEQLRQSQKLEGIGQLAGGIAHDFNNILNAIIGFSTLVHMELPEGSPLQTHISEVLAAGQRGAALTSQILAFSRKQELDVKAVDLNEVIRGIEKLLFRLLREDIQMRFVLSDTPLTVMADISQIDQVLINLSTNARDAMPEGGELSISTVEAVMDNEFIKAHGWGKPGQYALLRVGDSGTGMDERVKATIFEPFFTTKESGKGTGLGLAVVYGIIKQHKGFIGVETRPGLGTTFEIYLPLISCKAAKKQTKDASLVRGGDETILVADDDEGMRNSLARILEWLGYSVVQAVDGNDAVRKFRENEDRIKLLVLDVLMPFKGGKEAYDEISKIRQGIKALFMSGHSADEIATKHIVEKGLDFMPKPFKPDEFLRMIRDVLDRKA